MKNATKLKKWVKVNDRPNTWIEVDADIPDNIIKERFITITEIYTKPKKKRRKR